MADMWAKCTGERSCHLTSWNKYKRTWSILLLFAFCLKCDANFQYLEQHESFDPKRFFTGTWYETYRLNNALSNVAKCLEVQSHMDRNNIHFISSAYVPFLFSRKTYKSSTSTAYQQNANFRLEMPVGSWNVSVISTDYDNYALVFSRSITKHSHTSLPDMISIFKRNKNDKGFGKNLEYALEKRSISLNKLSLQRC